MILFDIADYLQIINKGCLVIFVFDSLLRRNLHKRDCSYSHWKQIDSTIAQIQQRLSYLIMVVDMITEQ